MIRPSKLGRVMACPASHRLSAGKSDYSDKTAADEGTNAHAMASDILNGNRDLFDISDPELRNAIHTYTSVCESYRSMQDRGGIEQNIAIEIADTTLRGTPDFWSVSKQQGLTVVDFKYGYRPIEPDSWQLIAYATMLWESEWGMDWTPETVNLVIVQPRGRHPEGVVRRFTFQGDLLRGYRNQLANGIGLALQAEQQAIPGPHCYRCPALMECKANGLAVLGAIDVAINGECLPLSSVMVALELDTLQRATKLIKNRLAAMEEYAYATITGGGTIPGYCVKAGMSPLKWVVSDPIAAASEIGIDIAKPQEPITPTQAVSRGLITKEQIKFMARREQTAPKLEKVNLKSIENLIKGA